uniref:Aa_trans domain-containing protein n=1 Tax=Steinernema glaseri TaxID=37863 RepID=A0A1I7ZLP7_9BILA
MRRNDSDDFLIVQGSEESLENGESEKHRLHSSSYGGSQDSIAEGFNQWPHIFNLTNCIVGVSVLAMPFCYQQCGILLATVLIGTCAYITKITCHALYKGAHVSRRKSYEALAMHTFGHHGRKVTEIAILLYLMSSIMAFLVVIGDIGPDVVADYLQLQAPTQRLRILVMIVVVLCVVVPLSLLRNLDSLSVVSSVTVVFYFCFVAKMLLNCLPRIFDERWTQDIVWWRTEGVLTSLPIIAMALSCQMQIFCVADCIPKAAPWKIDYVVGGAVNLCSMMYAAVGTFGYIAYSHHPKLHGDILLYLPSSFLTQLMKVAFMLSVAVSVPLMLFPTRNALHNLLVESGVREFASTSIPRMSFYLYTFGILTVNLILAILIPNVEFVLGLTGSLIGSLVTIVLPALMFMRVVPVTSKNSSVHIAAKVCLVIGVCILVGSTWATLHQKQESHVVDAIIPKVPQEKDILAEAQAENSLFEANINMSQKVAELAEKTLIEEKGEEAEKLLEAMKIQQIQQHKIIEEQKHIVDRLNQMHNEHKEQEQAEKVKEQEQAEKVKEQEQAEKVEEQEKETDKKDGALK